MDTNRLLQEYQAHLQKGRALPPQTLYHSVMADYFGNPETCPR